MNFLLKLLLPLLMIISHLQACESATLPSITNAEIDEPEQTRDKRGTKFIDGPNDKPCLLSSGHTHHDLYYDHVDESGRHCDCPLCHIGKILVANCSCDDPKPQRVTDCLFVKAEKMMPYFNKCETGIDCKKCEYPWTMKSPCRHTGPDTVCKCVESHYQATPDDCRPVPRCDKGFELIERNGEDVLEMLCQPCLAGYYQPDNNSTSHCSQHRVCTVEEGTSYSDSKCLNGPETELKTATNPEDESIPQTPTDATIRPTDETTMENGRGVGEDHETASNEGVTSVNETEEHGTDEAPESPCDGNGWRRPPHVLCAPFWVFIIIFLCGLLCVVAAIFNIETIIKFSRMCRKYVQVQTEDNNQCNSGNGANTVVTTDDTKCTDAPIDAGANAGAAGNPGANPAASLGLGGVEHVPELNNDQCFPMVQIRQRLPSKEDMLPT